MLQITPPPVIMQVEHLHETLLNTFEFNDADLDKLNAAYTADRQADTNDAANLIEALKAQGFTVVVEPDAPESTAADVQPDEVGLTDEEHAAPAEEATS